MRGYSTRSGRTLLLVLMFSMSIGCANKFEVPSQVSSEVTVRDSTHTVRHEIVVSVEMTEMFENECATKADEQGLIEPMRTEFISLCVAQKTQEFISSILAIINAGQGSNP